MDEPPVVRAGRAKTDQRGSGRVEYDVEDHFGIIFQMYGSVWGRVLPCCILNVVITLTASYLLYQGIIDLTFSDKGHTFMAALVSFLVVVRSNISYHRWNTSRKLISTMMYACRGLVQHAVVFTRKDVTPQATKWRAEVATRTVTVMRTIVNVIQNSGDEKKRATWLLSELDARDQADLLISLGPGNERSPINLITFLRSAIAEHVNYLATPLDVNQELLLFTHSCTLYAAYLEFEKLNTSPFPFPLVQMTRTFLFFWIFTLPFALAGDFKSLPAYVIMIFFITYGFLGIEFVSIEMDDPFGEDANDFDVINLASVVFDDIYVTIRDVDGSEKTQKLREYIEDPPDRDIVSRNQDTIIKSQLLDVIFEAGRQANQKFGQTDKFLVDLNSCRVINSHRLRHHHSVSVKIRVDEKSTELV